MTHSSTKYSISLLLRTPYLSYIAYILFNLFFSLVKFFNLAEFKILYHHFCTSYFSWQPMTQSHKIYRNRNNLMNNLHAVSTSQYSQVYSVIQRCTLRYHLPIKSAVRAVGLSVLQLCTVLMVLIMKFRSFNCCDPFLWFVRYWFGHFNCLKNKKVVPVITHRVWYVKT